MVNRSKQLGTSWETEVVRYLAAHGHPLAERRAQAGAADKGDVSGIAGTVIECKNVRKLDLAGWCDELAAERRNAGAKMGAVVVKRSRKNVSEAYCVVSLADLAELLFLWVRQ
jgi:hypothetical protein